MPVSSDGDCLYELESAVPTDTRWYIRLGLETRGRHIRAALGACGMARAYTISWYL